MTSGSDYRPPMRLEESSYVADFELLDRYQRFSAEILRLSLAVFAGMGFLLGSDSGPAESVFSALVANDYAKAFLIAGMILLVGASVAALAHRYFSTDSMHYFLQCLRFADHQPKFEKSRSQRDRMFKLSWIAILLAPWALGLAVACLGTALVIALFSI